MSASPPTLEICGANASGRNGRFEPTVDYQVSASFVKLLAILRRLMPLLDPPLTPRPKSRLSHLRHIGWSVWDPIGMLSSGQKWSDEDCLPFAGEYDSYIGPGPGDGVLERAERTQGDIRRGACHPGKGKALGLNALLTAQRVRTPKDAQVYRTPAGSWVEALVHSKAVRTPWSHFVGGAL